VLNLTAPAAEAMPRLVLGQILYGWVRRCTGVELRSERLLELRDRVLRPLELGRVVRGLTISGEWDLVQTRAGLYLMKREFSSGWKPAKPANPMKRRFVGKPKR
jgi:hypothetical protein